jgi:cell pole-organizing protein PopZ
MRQAGEPEVEEILDSIKKVIARDNRVVGGEEKRPTPVIYSHQAVPASEPEVLDLDQSSALAAEEPAPLVEPDPTPLVAHNAVTAMRESLAALATAAAPETAPPAPRTGETTLEGLVRELLRPQLAEWLDKNLPPMVERLVAAEISRIVGK